MRLRVFRRFLQLRLSGALFCLTLHCVILAFWARAYRQRAAIEKITAEAGVVTCKNEVGRKPSSPVLHHTLLLDEFFRQPVNVTWTKQGWCDQGREIDLAPLGALPSLRELDLHHSSMSPKSYPALAQLTELRVLNFGYSNADDVVLQQIAAADHLKVLFLNGTYVTDRGVAHLAGLQDLETLDLSGTDISDRAVESLARCTALKRLSLSGTDVSDQAVESLARCTALEVLKLNETRITRRASAELKRLFPNATIDWSFVDGRRRHRWKKRERRFDEPPDPLATPPLNSVL